MKKKILSIILAAVMTAQGVAPVIGEELELVSNNEIEYIAEENDENNQIVDFNGEIDTIIEQDTGDNIIEDETISLVDEFFGEPLPVGYYEDATAVIRNGNFSLTRDPVTDIIAVARSQTGKTGGQLGYTAAWCAS